MSCFSQQRKRTRFRRRRFILNTLLGLLRDERDFAASLLSGRGLHLASTRDELRRKPHDDSIIEEFVREPSALPEGVAESRSRLRSIVTRMEQALAERDFV